MSMRKVLCSDLRSCSRLSGRSLVGQRKNVTGRWGAKTIGGKGIGMGGWLTESLSSSYRQHSVAGLAPLQQLRYSGSSLSKNQSSSVSSEDAESLTSSRKVLCFEYTFDDCSAAIVTSCGRVLASHALHGFSELLTKSGTGGVNPLHAGFFQQRSLPIVLERVMEESGFVLDDIDYIAAPVGPGQGMGLQNGMNFVKKLCVDLDVPFIAVHHVEAHITVPRLSARMLKSVNGLGKGKGKGKRGAGLNSAPIKLEERITDFQNAEVEYPFLSMLMTGGHCELVLARSAESLYTIGRTMDDAPGEAFDKVARALELDVLAYGSGGLAVEMCARNGGGSPDVLGYPDVRLQGKDANFSFSGIKSHCMGLAAELKKNKVMDDKERELVKSNICNSFQFGVAKHMMVSLLRAVEYLTRHGDRFGLETYAVDQRGRKKAYRAFKTPLRLSVTGGVACNSFITTALTTLVGEMGHIFDPEVAIPEKRMCCDNAVMIGWNALERLATDPRLLIPPEQISTEIYPVLPLNDTHMAQVDLINENYTANGSRSAIRLTLNALTQQQKQEQQQAQQQIGDGEPRRIVGE
eukprot:Nk52_evm5s2438 gene=Nk52_evmTU5s2438